MNSDISPVTKTSALVAQVRADIIQGTFAPGSKLRTTELAERYGVSLVPMREALCRLASSGFVVAEDQRGFRVAEISADELADITQTRIFVEQEAARRSISNGDLAWETALIAAHHRLSRLLPEKGAGAAGLEWEEAHDAFHSTLLSACDSRWLLNLSRMLREQTARYRHLSMRDSALKKSGRDLPAEHRALLDAALVRDADRVADLLREHFIATMELVAKQSYAVGNAPSALARKGKIET